MMHDYVNRHFYTMNTVLGYYEVRFYFLFACRANLFVLSLFSFFIFDVCIILFVNFLNCSSVPFAHYCLSLFLHT